MPCEGFLCGGASIVLSMYWYATDIISPYDARNLLRAFTGVYAVMVYVRTCIISLLS